MCVILNSFQSSSPSTVVSATSKSGSKRQPFPSHGLFKCLACDVQLCKLWAIMRHTIEVHSYIRWKCPKCQNMFNRKTNKHGCLGRGENMVCVFTKSLGDGKFEKLFGDDAIRKLSDFRDNEMPDMIERIGDEPGYRPRRPSPKPRGRSTKRKESRSPDRESAPKRKSLVATQALDLTLPEKLVSPLPPTPKRDSSIPPLPSSPEAPPLYEDISDDETQPCPTGVTGDFAMMAPPIAISALRPIVPLAVEKFSPIRAPSVSGSSSSSSSSASSSASSSSSATSSSSASTGSAKSGTGGKMTHLKPSSVQPEPVNTPVVTSSVKDTRNVEARSVSSTTVNSITFTTPSGSSPPSETSRERLTVKDRDQLLHLRACGEKKMVLNIGGKQFYTSHPTLLSVQPSLFSKILHKDSPFLRTSAESFFLDRDYKHFDAILNYLRNHGKLPIEVLPRDLKHLNELKVEANFYQLPKLTEMCNERIRSLFDTSNIF